MPEPAAFRLLSPKMCGAWDGIHLWLQWDDAAPEVGCRLQIRTRPADSPEWTGWLDAGGAKPLRRPWISLPVMREGHFAQARVCAEIVPPPWSGGSGDLWQDAGEVTFLKSRAPFEFLAGARPAHYLPGSEFGAIVDGAACVYVLQEEVELAPGERAEAAMESFLATGFAQLDAPGDFTLRPSMGRIIRNLAPSENDTEATGRDETRLVALPRRAPVKAVFGRNLFR
jgi:hypothetical protein